MRPWQASTGGPFHVNHPMTVGGVQGLSFDKDVVVTEGWWIGLVRDGQPVIEKATPEEAAEFYRRWPRVRECQAFIPIV